MPTPTETFRRMLEAGAPSELARYKLDGSPLPKSVAGLGERLLAALAASDPSHHSVVYLSGPAHVCKSSLALRLAWRQVHHKDVSVAWLTPWKLKAELANNYGSPKVDYVDFDVLVLDDIAMPDSRVATAYYDILMGRYERTGSTTVITTNLEFDPLIETVRAVLGERPAERLSVRLIRGIENGAALDFSSIPTQGLH